MSAAHTFYLEELKLTPGDSVSYFARATDNIGRNISSDLYFIRIRKLDEQFRSAMSMGGGGGGGGVAAAACRSMHCLSSSAKSFPQRTTSSATERR